MDKQKFYPTRIGFLAAGLVTCGILASTLYFQFIDKYEPCPLCIMQRVLLFIVATILLVVSVHNPQQTGQRIYCGLVFCFSSLGLYTAGHQVWLQHLPPDQIPPCGPGLNVLLANFPLRIIVKELFYGSGQCAVVTWQWLGLSFAGWAMVLFSLLLVFSIAQFWLADRAKSKSKYHG